MATFEGRALNVQNVITTLNEGKFSAANVEMLGLMLGVEKQDLDKFRINRSGAVQNMLIDIINHWILNSAASWEKLGEALGKCGYGKLAGTLLKKSPEVEEGSLHMQQGLFNNNTLPITGVESECDGAAISETLDKLEYDGAAISETLDKSECDGAAISATLDTEERIYEFESQFGELVDTVKNIINSNPSLRIKFQRGVKYGLPQRLQGFKKYINYSIIKADDVSEFFWNFNDLCSFLDYDLLNFIIKRFGTAEVKNQMEKYRKEVEDFCNNTTIDELIKHWKPRFAQHKIPEELKTCVIKLDWNPSAKRVIDLKIIQHKIESVLPHEQAMAAYFLVYKVKASSVTVVWLLWTEFLPQIIPSLEELLRNFKFVKEYRIQCCSIGEDTWITTFDEEVSTRRIGLRKRCTEPHQNWTSNAVCSRGDADSPKYLFFFEKFFGAYNNDAYKRVERWISQKNEFSLILVGKVGAGKSTLVNSLLNISVEEGGADVGHSLFSVTKEVKDYVQQLKFSRHNVDVRIWDTPGLMVPDKEKARLCLDSIRKTWHTNDIALLIYCIDMTQVRTDAGDKNAIRMLTEELGENIWDYSLFALTHANEVKLPVNAVQGDTLQVYFQDKLRDWARVLSNYLRDANVRDEMADNNIPLIPCGYRENPVAILQEPNWSLSFWKVCLARMLFEQIPAFLTIRPDSNDGSLNEDSAQVMVQRLVNPRLEDTNFVRFLLQDSAPTEITSHLSAVMKAKMTMRNAKTAAVLLMGTFACPLVMGLAS